MKKISVIIPTYKPQDWLLICLKSFNGQTMPREDFEIILVLNGETDPYDKIIQGYINNFPQLDINYLKTTKAGVSNARNMGLDIAQGEYISFMDDDDYASPSYLEELLTKASPDTVSICRPIAFDENGKELPYRLTAEYKRYCKQGKQIFYRPKKLFSGPCMKLFHRDIIGDNRYDTRFKKGEDSLFMFLVSNKIKYVDFTSDKAIYFRSIRTGSASRQNCKFRRTLHNQSAMIREYCKIYTYGRGYNFNFFATRILGAIKTIIVSLFPGYTCI